MSLVPAFDQQTEIGQRFGEGLRKKLRGDLRASILVILLFFAVGGGWAYFTKITGAVMGSGRVTVEAQLQRVQYLEGGILQTLFVKDGDAVEAGQLLAQMDASTLQAQFEIARNRVIESYLLLERTEAELLGKTTFSVPQELRDVVGDIDFTLPLQSQRHILQNRLREAETERSIYERNASIAKDTADSRRTILDSIKHQLDLSREEADMQSGLLQKGLAKRSAVLAAERDYSNLAAQVSQTEALLASSENEYASAKLQIEQLGEKRRNETLQLQQDTRASLSEQINQYQTQKNALARAEIRAPRSGVVHELAVNTPGQVIPPGGDLMMIVPSDDELVLEARIPPSEVDQVYVGQQARVRIGAYDARLLQDLTAKVIFVSADVIVDSAGRTTYYTVKLKLDPGEIDKLGDITLVPGMPITTFMQKEERTVLSFLIQPLIERLEHTFRD